MHASSAKDNHQHKKTMLKSKHPIYLAMPYKIKTSNPEHLRNFPKEKKKNSGENEQIFRKRTCSKEKSSYNIYYYSHTTTHLA